MGRSEVTSTGREIILGDADWGYRLSGYLDRLGARTCTDSESSPSARVSVTSTVRESILGDAESRVRRPTPFSAVMSLWHASTMLSYGRDLEKLFTVKNFLSPTSDQLTLKFSSRRSVVKPLGTGVGTLAQLKF